MESIILLDIPRGVALDYSGAMIRLVGASLACLRSLLGALVLLGCLVGQAHAATPCMEPVQCRAAMAFEGHKLPLFVSADINKPQPDIRRALVVVHGTEGNAASYFRFAIEAARIARKLNDTLVIAPRFIDQRESENGFLDEREFSWSRGSDWRAGDLSDRNAPPRVSSFELMNQLLSRLADSRLFPNLSAIVLAGHSAGGQFVQRYAIGQPDDPALKRLTVTYVVANPGSYLYLDNHRPDKENPENFVVPPISECQVNRFKYGLESPNAYFKQQSVDEMTVRYRARNVVYLLGEMDVDPNAENLARTCAALAQGENRFARGKAFAAYMETLYWPNNHRMVTVPGVGHSARGMFQSSQGLKLLFE